MIFRLDSPTIKTMIVRSKDILLSYQTMLGRLTKIDFSLRKKDPWKEELGFQDEYVTKLIYRIDVVYSVWATNHEITTIFPPQHQQELKRLNLLEV